MDPVIGKERIKRLQRLKLVMERVEKKRKKNPGCWNFRTWGYKFARKGKLRKDHLMFLRDAEALTSKAPPECGTIACAAGWAALDPWFRKKGFKSLKQRTGRGKWNHWDEKTHSTVVIQTAPSLLIHINGRSNTGDSRAAFFGVHSREEQHLFIVGPPTPNSAYSFDTLSGRTTPKDIAAYIDTLITKYSDPHRFELVGQD